MVRPPPPPQKQARKSFAILSLEVSRDMKSVAAGPLSKHTQFAPSHLDSDQPYRNKHIQICTLSLGMTALWTYSNRAVQIRVGLELAEASTDRGPNPQASLSPFLRSPGFFIISVFSQKSPCAHKNKIGTPPSPRKPKVPPRLKRGILWTWRFSCRTKEKIPGAHKIGAPISGTRKLTKMEGATQAKPPFSKTPFSHIFQTFGTPAPGNSGPRETFLASGRETPPRPTKPLIS